MQLERDVGNVTAAVRDMNIDYPIALGNGHAIRRAFENHFWPALYIADGQGRLRYHHFGEGEYAMAEMVVQQLLVEAGARTVDPDLVSVEARWFEVAADRNNLRSPETYLGSTRIAGFASPDGLRFGEPSADLEPLWGIAVVGSDSWSRTGLSDESDPSHAGSETPLRARHADQGPRSAHRKCASRPERGSSGSRRGGGRQDRAA